jgi:hypothetical protein
MSAYWTASLTLSPDRSQYALSLTPGMPPRTRLQPPRTTGRGSGRGFPSVHVMKSLAMMTEQERVDPRDVVPEAMRTVSVTL